MCAMETLVEFEHTLNETQETVSGLSGAWLVSWRLRKLEKLHECIQHSIRNIGEALEEMRLTNRQLANWREYIELVARKLDEDSATNDSSVICSAQLKIGHSHINWEKVDLLDIKVHRYLLLTKQLVDMMFLISCIITHAEEKCAHDYLNQLKQVVISLQQDYSATADELFQLRDDVERWVENDPTLCEMTKLISGQGIDELIAYNLLRDEKTLEFTRLCNQDNMSTMLKVATAFERMTLVSYMLEDNPWVDATPALNMAIKRNNKVLIQWFLDAKSPGDVDITPLVRRGDLELIKMVDQQHEIKPSAKYLYSAVDSGAETITWLLNTFPELKDSFYLHRLLERLLNEEKFELAEMVSSKYNVQCDEDILHNALVNYRPRVLEWMYKQCPKLFTTETLKRVVRDIVERRPYLLNLDSLVHDLEQGTFPKII